MILVDSSVWIDHLRRADGKLQALLDAGQVICHPFIIGELAVGHLRSRKTILDSLSNLPQAILAEHEEVMGLIERHGIFGTGIGYVDVHLLASTQISSARLWSHDKILKTAAKKLKIAY